MANNHKKSNGGRKSAVKPTKPAPRHQSSSTATRTTPVQPGSPTTIRSAGTSSTVERKPTEFTRQQIAEAAYFLWQKRGGNEISNWLEAERLLRSGATVR